MDQLPPWLRNLPLPALPASRRGGSDPAPDWLQGINTPVQLPPAPNWLQDEMPGAMPTTRSGDSESVPDWLMDLQPEPEPPSSGGATPAASVAQPDWLADLSAEVDDQPAMSDGPVRNDAPAWLSDLEDNQQGAPVSGKPKPFGATQWLDSLAAAAPPAATTPSPTLQPAPPAKPPTPPTLGGDTYSTTTSSRIRIPVGATDWLRSIGQEPDDEPLAQASTPQKQPPPTDPGEEVPDWLRDISAEELAEDMIVEPAPEPKAAPAKAMPIFDPSAPGWLGDDDSLPADRTIAADDWLSDQPSSVAETMAADSMPNWLSDVGASPERRKAPSGPAWLSPNDDEAGDGADDDMPAWLRDVGTSSPPSSQPTAKVDNGDSDDGSAWLQAEQPAAFTEPSSDVPAWLNSDLPPVDNAGHRKSTGSIDPVDDDDVPAWLRGAPPAPEPLAEPADEVPAWLRDAGPPDNLPERSALRATPLDEVPSWLRQDEPLDGPAPAVERSDDLAPVDMGGFSWLRNPEPPTPDVPPATPDGSLPSWLSAAEEAPPAPLRPAARADIPPWLATEPETASGSVSPSDAGLPSWLRGAVDDPAPAAPVPISPPLDSPRPPPGREAGSWLFDEEDQPVVSGRDQPPLRGGNDLLRGTDLPNWLRVPEPEPTPPSAEGKALDWLSRLGSVETEESDSIPSVAAAPVVPMLTRPTYSRSADQVAAMALLERLNRNPYPAPVVRPASAQPTLWQRIGVERVLYSILMLALLIVTLVPGFTGALQTATPNAPGADELSAAIEQLGPDDVVLLAYEWDAQRSGELRPIEQAVTRHLISKKAKLILVSTDPAGTLLSFDLLEPLRAAGYNNENGVNFGGRDYVLLGYRPGGELALRAMAQDLRGMLRSDFEGRDATPGAVATNFDGTPRVNTLNDLAMIVVMADQPQDVQVWMEQIHSMSRNVPIAFLMPSETQPLVQPYLRQANVLHLAGEQGTLAYTVRSGVGDSPANVTARSGQLGFAVLAFLLLVVVGAVANGLLRRRSTRQGAA